jgi:hypothetical protein
MDIQDIQWESYRAQQANHHHLQSLKQAQTAPLISQ